MIRQYAGPLTVLAAGAVGFSFFLIVAAAAITSPRAPNASQIDLEPQSLVDSAVSNMNTMAALTVEAVSQYIPTATVTPSRTSVPTETEAPTFTATLHPTRTRIPPTRTREPSDPPPIRTATSLPTRTATPEPTFTSTSIPTFTDTPIPTDTPEPPPTDAPVPTDTPEPSLTNTSEPPPATIELPIEVATQP